MNREQKAVAIAEIANHIDESEAIFAVDYRGISVAQVAELRTQLRAVDASFKVVKNSLTERAADQVGAEALKDYLIGPTRSDLRPRRRRAGRQSGRRLRQSDPAAALQGRADGRRGARGRAAPLALPAALPRSPLRPARRDRGRRRSAVWSARSTRCSAAWPWRSARSTRRRSPGRSRPGAAPAGRRSPRPTQPPRRRRPRPLPKRRRRPRPRPRPSRRPLPRRRPSRCRARGRGGGRAED